MIRILIVEDEKPIADLLRMSLTRAGYICKCLYDGGVAADVLEKGEHIYDLILLDVDVYKRQAASASGRNCF